jgi:TM2 domain-containing membrane protein YozV
MPNTPVPATVSPKSRTATFLLGLFTGFAGGHRFYAGKIGTAILQLCTLGGLGIWWMADLVLILTGEFTDAEGRRITSWVPADDVPARSAGENPRILEEMEQLHSEVYELQERVDFLERTLAQVRERPGLGPGR